MRRSERLTHFCVVTFFGFFASVSLASADDANIYDLERYRPAHSEYDSWLAFMDKAPDKTWQSASVRRWVDEPAFQRCTSNKEISVETFRYLSDGLSIRAFMARPKASGVRHPVVVFAHGGVAEWGKVTFFDILEMCRLAEQGYVVVAPTLRGEGGSEGKANLGPGEVSDMLSLLRVISRLDSADAQRIGIWGFSRGGGLTYRLLAATDKLRAAVVVGAPAAASDRSKWIRIASTVRANVRKRPPPFTRGRSQA